MSQSIGVECKFEANGRIRIDRIQLDGKWLPVGQGRQWSDENGRHLLIMLPNNQTRELLLRADTLTWMLLPSRTAVV
ncbi:MAG: hypothetical protein HF973_07050 [Chloroflexi bacterium]|nr:hypothetical protein [Chloroflexota bacterium]